jgi:hypothetical protein
MLAKATKRVTVPVTLKALTARINRKLKADGEMLKAARSVQVAASVGWYFVVRGDAIVTRAVDPEELGRKLGVLAEWEHLHLDGEQS